MYPGTAPTLVAVAHGSPDPRARDTIHALLRRVRALRPGLRVELGHLETDEPLLGDTLARLRGDAVLVPLLFSRGYHVKHDLPGVLAAAPHLRAEVAACLGPHPLLVEALRHRLVEGGYTGGAVVLAAAGSRDPESAAGTRATAAMLSARLGGVPVLPAYASAASPTVARAVAHLRELGHREIALSSCFTAPGWFASRCAEAAPGVVGAPIGAHPALARLLLHRHDRAVADSRRTAPPALAAAAA
ncbi:CbiX/SirB N-terminal domain-containing protein [Streptomyces sp. ACA25]|uniref:sirohydrochlorin chelatase n=1 Tax=Streptomyces sp. ACA25 TaxID=3022596 RepID=UPI002306EDF4|nr:CbiX/SirB N-terminal domain-containing protein [Streptomyces sp. ACA25]MDB1088276.1 CbiX/SirB N-terminal domain-containing protein [Streptomyces sp. ACA25]